MIVITGASDGLGRSVALLYKAQGKTVVNMSRQLASDCDISISLDLSQEKSIAEAVHELQALDEPIEAFVNCAGTIKQHMKPSDMTYADVKSVFEVNVQGVTWLLSQLHERFLRDQTTIVNISSTVGLKGRKEEAAYGASKWAMRGLTASLQDLYKGTPVRVVSFCPGGFKTRFFEKGTGIDNTGDGSEWMKVEDVASLLKTVIDLPKNMEVSEIVINRK